MEGAAESGQESGSEACSGDAGGRGRGQEAYKTEGMRMEKAYVKHILRVYAGHFETNATIPIHTAFLFISLLFS